MNLPDAAPPRPLKLNFVRLADTPRSPWLNGGGFKRDLLVTPDLLLSVAEIEKDGFFSSYLDQQRFFAIISEAGVTLGASSQWLTDNSPVFEFAGEDAPYCGLRSGTATAFNLMVRRSRMKGWLRRLPRTSEPTQLMFDSTQTLREKPAVDHQSVAEPGSKVFGVFVNHPAVLIEKVGAARNEHLLDAAGIAWMQGDAVGSTWFVHSLHANTPLQALIFQCAMLRLPS